MTNEEHARLTRALVRKCGPLLDLYPTFVDSGVPAIVSSVIADTVLVCEGVSTIEDYEPDVV